MSQCLPVVALQDLDDDKEHTTHQVHETAMGPSPVSLGHVVDDLAESLAVVHDCELVGTRLPCRPVRVAVAQLLITPMQARHGQQSRPHWRKLLTRRRQRPPKGAPKEPRQFRYRNGTKELERRLRFVAIEPSGPCGHRPNWKWRYRDGPAASCRQDFIAFTFSSGAGASNTSWSRFIAFDTTYSGIARLAKIFSSSACGGATASSRFAHSLARPTPRSCLPVGQP